MEKVQGARTERVGPQGLTYPNILLPNMASKAKPKQVTKVGAACGDVMEVFMEPPTQAAIACELRPAHDGPHFSRVSWVKNEEGSLRLVSDAVWMSGKGGLMLLVERVGLGNYQMANDTPAAIVAERTRVVDALAVFATKVRSHV